MSSELVFAANRIASAKRAFTTRRVPIEQATSLLMRDECPRIGDLVLAVVDKIGSHSRLELPSGRKAQLSVGDDIIVAYGNRYAPDQFEAIVGKGLAACHLVAAGGIAATKVNKHEGIANPTQITPVGLLANSAGKRLNLAGYALPFDDAAPPVTTILVAGTSMNAGKTTTAAGLIHALAKAGYKVAGIKSTGTGAGGDLWLMSDMGAHAVLDFTDGGLPSTYLVEPETIERTVLGLIGHAAKLGCDVAVVEVADGLQHEETATLLSAAAIRESATGIVFAANDALGAKAGVKTLQSWGYRILAISGQMTRSPLAVREAARATCMPVITLSEIQAGCLNSAIFASAANPAPSKATFQNDGQVAA